MKMISRRNFLKAAGLTTAALSLAACGGKPSSGAANNDAASNNDTAAPSGPKYGGNLRYAYGNACATPGYAPLAAANAHLPYLTLAYENLLTYADDGKLVGKLATAWEVNPEEPSITWTLREGVQFADGTPFNAEAVKVNIEEYQANNRTEVANIASVEVQDDTHVKMNMVSFNSSTLESVGYFVFYMSPKALENDHAALENATCGTGPFQLSEFENNAYAVYTKNENYWQEGLPYLDSVELVIITETTTMQTAFRAGEYDVCGIGNFVPTAIQELQADGIYQETINHNGMGVGTLGLIPNSKIDSPWADARVRRAMCYAIDMDALNAAFMLGTGTIVDEWATPGAITYNKDINHMKYDPARAKELLAEAGYPDGFDSEIMMISALQDMLTAANNMLAEVGIRCKVNMVDGATQNQHYMDGTWVGLMPHWTTVSPDLGLYMGRHLDYNGAYYAKGIQHPDYEMGLLESIRACTDMDEKHKLEHELQKAIYDAEEGSILFGRPMFVNSSVFFMQPEVKGLKIGENFSSDWDCSTAWIDR